MTNDQKLQIISLRKRGNSLAEIASKLGLPIGTVKSFCSRNHLVAEAALDVEEPTANQPLPPVNGGLCKKCGAPITSLPHHRSKLFCSDKCRLSWWHDNRHLARGAAEKVCPVCGSPFTADGSRKYCSHSCYITGRYRPTEALEVQKQYDPRSV